MIRNSILRAVSPLKPSKFPAGHFESLNASIRGKARKVGNAIRSAREAAVFAGTDESDDIEREEARQMVRHALQCYVALAARGDPPVQLDPQGRVIETKDGGNEENQQKGGNDVVTLLEEDVESMKEEIFMSNRQRVWMGWRGWF